MKDEFWWLLALAAAAAYASNSARAEACVSVVQVAETGCLAEPDSLAWHNPAKECVKDRCRSRSAL